MKRTICALVPWMVLASSAFGQTKSADVAYGHVNAIPTRAYRLVDQCFVPIDAVSAWGWTVVSRGDQAEVEVEGRKLTVPLRIIASRPCLTVSKIVESLGGKSGWLPGTDTFAVWSELQSIKFRDGKLAVESPLTVKPAASVLSGPERVVIDLEGARIGKATKRDLQGGAQVVQIRPNTVRITVETAPGGSSMIAIPGPTRSLSIDLRPLDVQPQVVELEPEPEPVQTGVVDPGVPPTTPTVTPTVTAEPPIAPPPTFDLPLRVDTESKTATLLTIGRKDIPTASFQKTEPSVIEIRLPGVFLRLPDGFQLATDAVTAATTRIEADSTILSLALSRPMGAEMWTDAEGIRIQLLKPNVGDGKLAGKIVVVDPGHGGNDSGATVGGVREKDINLAVGRLITAELAAHGATVVMTRKTDVFVTLSGRADIANRNKADFFISTHINSTAKANSTSGTITFHHKGRNVGRLLAECIQNEIAKVNGLPDIGVWSDGRIYQNGFAVLRQTTMPGVLLELAFVNHSRDRARMQEKEFQESVAKAVVRGIKVFLGDE